MLTKDIAGSSMKPARATAVKIQVTVSCKEQQCIESLLIEGLSSIKSHQQWQKRETNTQATLPLLP